MSIKVTRKESASRFLGLVVNKTVFLSAISVIIFSIGFTLIFEQEADYYFGMAQTFVSAHGGWIYTLAVNLFIVYIWPLVNLVPYELEERIQNLSLAYGLGLQCSLVLELEMDWYFLVLRTL